MEDLGYMVTFARVVKAGSFAGAAKRLGMTSSVASKHVAKLEKALGVRLLNRSTRKLSLTEAGAAYYEHCARIVDEIESSKSAIAQLQAAPRGLLRVTAPVTFANTRLGPILREFFARYPDIQLRHKDMQAAALEMVEGMHAASIQDYGVPDVDQLYRAYSQGGMLFIRALHKHWETVAALCRKLEQRFEHPVSADLYLVHQDSSGFRPHFHTYDDFVLQIEGCERWRTYDGTPWRESHPDG